LHGWVYDLRTGFLKELAEMPPGAKIDDIYRFDWDDEEESGTAAKNSKYPDAVPTSKTAANLDSRVEP
jgi:hypothetical protein